MCGVIGLLIKDRSLEPSLGELLAPMLCALADRGPDSSGIAVYSESGGAPWSGAGGAPSSGAGGAPWSGAGGAPWLRISLGSDGSVDWSGLAAELADAISGVGRGGGADAIRTTVFPRGLLVEAPDPLVPATMETLARWPAVRVVGTGRSVVVVKDTGRPEETCRRYRLAGWSGYLAVAHTRMATESAVTLLHSHPFVPDEDMCIVHNGSFSNYATVRRELRAQGVAFDSDNDSEVAARLLAVRLASGDDLEEATRWIMKELDGFFTLVIATAGAMSVVRDTFACKPAVVAETDQYVAVASEYRALAHLPGVSGAHVFEPQPQEVYRWTR